MSAFLQLLTSILATLGAYGLSRLGIFLYREWTSHLRVVPGPPIRSYFFGNFTSAGAALWENSGALHEQWVKEYGKTIVYKGLLGMNRLYTTDLKALSHIMMHSNTYQKPDMIRYALRHLLGNGVFIVEGEEHKRQRRVMNPAFGPAQIRELTEVFVGKSLQLRDIWLSEAQEAGGVLSVNASTYFSRLTLDVIGLAGFNYNFDALTTDPKDNELNNAFDKLFKGKGVSAIMVIKALVPALRWMKTSYDKQLDEIRNTMNRIGMELIQKSKTELSEKYSVLERDSVRGKHLLTLLLRSNMASDLPPSQRLTDSEVSAQVPTFLAAGHETTSTATAWTMYALSLAPHIQSKLREELLTVGTDNPTMDELNALPYLDAVVRESMRVHAPIASSMRAATQDDAIPLETPFTDRNGIVHDYIEVKKGQSLLIPIAAINVDTSLWGEDAHEFRPERWENLPKAVAGIPGVWGNMLSFLGGPRGCIGWRFSVVETKAIIFTLLRAFEVELGVPADEIIKGSSLVQRPVLRSRPKDGVQMPLIIKPIQKV
ncbi:cytochrome P450 [Coprinopsis marcescibilis]|uniref:Cytochrome P450 n=1 Tax=Coprinopsis marcescibilis TaxID=230819 RepID=A0A5C3KQM3_COPMA|nr:cytochrome P450 [Coprinopsis marcescibilis]